MTRSLIISIGSFEGLWNIIGRDIQWFSEKTIGTEEKQIVERTDSSDSLWRMCRHIGWAQEVEE